MEGINNIKKKILITIFTTLFLIGFIYPVYSQATSTQNNAVSSLESNSIIQWIINSSINGYSTAGQYLANFISIKRVPSYVWTSITFLMTTLLFVAIYAFLFEIFIQRTGISESETMKKAKILLIFVLSVFSAIAIGYAIPFLFNLYGFILLILSLVVLFFFGRAAVSYGKSVHYAAKSFAASVERDLLKVEKELKKARKDLSEQDVKFLEEGREKIYNDLVNINNEFGNAEKKFQTTLSAVVKLYKSLLNKLAYEYKNYLTQNQQNLSSNQKNDLDNLITYLEDKRDSLHPNMRPFQSMSELHDEILGEINNKNNLDKIHKQYLRDQLDLNYRGIILPHIPPLIQDAINEYRKVEGLLINFHAFENGFKKDFEVRFRHFLGAPDSRKYEIGILSAIGKSAKPIKEMENLINDRIKFLEKILH